MQATNGRSTVAVLVRQVSPAAMWATKQQRVRWRLPPLAPGASGDVKAYFEPDTAGDPVAEEGRRRGLTAVAVEEAVCRCEAIRNLENLNLMPMKGSSICTGLVTLGAVLVGPSHVRKWCQMEHADARMAGRHRLLPMQLHHGTTG